MHLLLFLCSKPVVTNALAINQTYFTMTVRTLCFFFPLPLRRLHAPLRSRSCFNQGVLLLFFECGRLHTSYWACSASRNDLSSCPPQITPDTSNPFVSYPPGELQ